MATVYYADPCVATAENDEPANAPLDPPLFPVSHAIYQQNLLCVWQNQFYDQLNLKVSRNKDRTPDEDLDNSTLDVGKSYAIYLPDLFDLGYTNVDFDLDTVPFHTETSAPWDYNGTDGFGFNQKVVFAVAGTHTIDAHVTYGGGLFTVSATFDVD